MKKKRTLINKCDCCGALFDGDKCEYCNARYVFEEIKEHKDNIISTSSYDLLGTKITIRLDNKEIDFYASEVHWEPFEYGSVPIMRLNLISYGEMRDVDENNT